MRNRWFVGLSMLVVVSILAGAAIQTGLPGDIRTVVIRNTVGFAPIIFYRDLEGDLLDDYENVFAVAHNAGDRLGATKEALQYGADIIEIDVISVGGQLYAGHDAPNSRFGTITYRGPTLAEIWAEAVTTSIVKFDLKESSPNYIKQIIAFLKDREGKRQVVIASRNQAALTMLRAALPQVILLYSVPNRAFVEALRANDPLLAVIDGVTIRATVLDEDTADWLHSLEMLIFAWTVNSLKTVNTLVRLGVNAITTDNLAIMELLGFTERPLLPRSRIVAAASP